VRISPDQAVTIGARLLGAEVVSARQVSGFAGNQVFELRLPDRMAYLKLAWGADAPRLTGREVAVLGYVRRRGLPAPAVEACDPLGEVTGVPCAVLADVGGKPLTGTEPVFRQVGLHLRHLHEIRAIGFGDVSADEDVVGDDSSWRQTLERPTVALVPAVDAGLVDATLLSRARSALDRFGPVLDGLEHVRLIHGDISPRHVYATDASITGIIDWGDAMAGDPSYDFGRLLHAGVRSGGLDDGRSLVAAVLSSYDDAPWLTGPRDPKLLLYAAMFGLSSMAAEFASGAPSVPFWPANAAALRTVLDALDTETAGQ
jgi:aminoglycoside phosphotransferase (APT) family kinase protein